MESQINVFTENLPKKEAIHENLLNEYEALKQDIDRNIFITYPGSIIPV